LPVARLSANERRQRLLDAAARVIARDGIANTTTRAITDEADMPRGMFHYCFDSKDELLGQLIQRHVTDMVEAATAEWRPDKPLAENLSAGMNAILNTGTTHPNEELISYELLIYALRSGLPGIAADQYRDYSRQAADYLQFVAKKASIRWALPLETLARMLATFVDGSMLHWLADQELDATRAAIDGFAASLTALAEPVRKTRSTSRSA
jgi:AcrR family transcriptional regulator